ncbi:hypothetical protein [Halorhabdus amylolytica]|uniref:hypothetical protein n=1 Tax=Halorhabdus amylolytica TaxID=2559573 RepID=UPI0010A9CD4E|nr:hypothetical protein [Halorhabdus amylolytica]
MDAPVDRERATLLACEQLVAALEYPGDDSSSDMCRLVDSASDVAAPLERGERSNREDIERAHQYTERVQERLQEVVDLFEWETPPAVGTGDSASDCAGSPELLENDELVALRSNIEEGLSVAQYDGASRDAAARMLELYARWVRRGHIYPPSRRGEWNRESHETDREN